MVAFGGTFVGWNFWRDYASDSIGIVDGWRRHLKSFAVGKHASMVSLCESGACCLYGRVSARTVLRLTVSSDA